VVADLADASQPRFAELAGVELVQPSDVRALLIDIAEPSHSRLSELILTTDTARPLTTASLEGSDAHGKQMLNLLGVPYGQRLVHLEEMVLGLVHALTREPAATIDVDTPLADEGGLDSLAASEIIARLRGTVGVNLSPSLLFEHITPRAIARHLVQLIEQESGVQENRMLTHAQPLYQATSYLEVSINSYADEHDNSHASGHANGRANGHANGNANGRELEFKVFQPQRRWRVLFLHGQGTSAELAHTLLGMRGWLASTLPFDFVIPDAPHQVAAWSSDLALTNLGLQGLIDSGLYHRESPQRMWAARFDQLVRKDLLKGGAMTSERDVDVRVQEYVNERSDQDADAHWQRTVEYLRGFIATHGPFDGIGGFSEGGAASHSLLRMQAEGVDLGLSGLRFCLAFSPWISPVNDRMVGYQPLRLPLLLTLGKRDLPIFTQAHPEYAAEFDDVIAHTHEGHHEYPLVTDELRRKCWDLVGRLQERGRDG